MIRLKTIKLRFSLIVLLTFSAVTAFTQNDDNSKILIQNFYQSCKSNNYGAFMAVNKGIQLFDTNQYGRSKKSFEKALLKDDEYCDAWYLIGYCYQKTGELDKAIESCNKALEIEPTNASALIVKANTLFLKGNTQEAIDIFNIAKGIIPNKVDAYYGLALMLHLTGDNQNAKQILNEMEENGAKTKIIRDKNKIKDLISKVSIG